MMSANKRAGILNPSLLRPGGFFFFFSSRRRHTRYWRDWSSDVCSSDLFPWCGPWAGELKRLFAAFVAAKQRQGVLDYDDLLLWWERMLRVPEVAAHLGARRSEERRVGKECRSRWSPYH